jgi:excisionase family DNA binding protein
MVIRRGVGEASVWCAACSAPTQTVTPREAAALAGISAGTVYRRAEAGRLHFVETAGPSPLICLNSLLVSTDQGGDERGA